MKQSKDRADLVIEIVNQVTDNNILGYRSSSEKKFVDSWMWILVFLGVLLLLFF